MNNAVTEAANAALEAVYAEAQAKKHPAIQRVMNTKNNPDAARAMMGSMEIPDMVELLEVTLSYTRVSDARRAAVNHYIDVRESYELENAIRQAQANTATAEVADCA